MTTTKNQRKQTHTPQTDRNSRTVPGPIGFEYQQPFRAIEFFLRVHDTQYPRCEQGRARHHQREDSVKIRIGPSLCRMCALCQATGRDVRCNSPFVKCAAGSHHVVVKAIGQGCPCMAELQRVRLCALQVFTYVQVGRAETPANLNLNEQQSQRSDRDETPVCNPVFYLGRTLATVRSDSNSLGSRPGPLAPPLTIFVPSGSVSRVTTS